MRRQRAAALPAGGRQQWPSTALGCVRLLRPLRPAGHCHLEVTRMRPEDGAPTPKGAYGGGGGVMLLRYGEAVMMMRLPYCVTAVMMMMCKSCAHRACIRVGICASRVCWVVGHACERVAGEREILRPYLVRTGWMIICGAGSIWMHRAHDAHVCARARAVARSAVQLRLKRLLACLLAHCCYHHLRSQGGGQPCRSPPPPV